MKIVYKLLSIECLESKFGKNRHSQLDWESIFRFLQQIPNKFLRYTPKFFGMTTMLKLRTE